MQLSTVLIVYSLIFTCASAFTNPIKLSGADPYMVYSDGYYYLMATSGVDLQITRAKSMAEMKNATAKVVYQESVPERSHNVWAPELHNMDGTWYIYYSAGPDTNNSDNQRMHAVRGSTSDIWTSTWSYAGRLVVPNRDVWGIDGTVMTLPSGRYWVYSSWDDAQDQQCLWIAKMNGPLSLGDGYKISAPTNPWEQVAWKVNEGPAPISHNGRNWIVYSASGCGGSGYSLASLELIGSDPLQMSSWKKSDGPIFTAANGSWGPGHNGFFTSPSGAPWMAYHASPTSDVRCDNTRRVLAKPIGYTSDGSLDLGQPRPLDENILEPV